MKLEIEIAEKYYTDIKESEHCGNYSVLYALDAIRNGTPLTERPKGKWIYQLNRINLPICSECDNLNEFGKEYKFCPNCGAYMREGGEE